MIDSGRSTDALLREIGALLAYPREDLSVEYKNWLDLGNDEHRADVAKALLAIANHGGGYVVFGFTEDAGVLKPALPRPASLDPYDQDEINGIVKSYAEPPFQCEVHHVVLPGSSDLFPIVVVPGNHTTPIRARRDGTNHRHVTENTYYIRRPGPSSEAPRTGREWDELIRRCLLADRERLFAQITALLKGAPPEDAKLGPSPADRLLVWETETRERWAHLVKTKLPPDEKPTRFHRGIWIVSYLIDGGFTPPDLPTLEGILRKISGHATGWPVWMVPDRSSIAPYPYEGTLECWLPEQDNPKGWFDDPGHSDFWRAAPDGRLTLIRGHVEDGKEDKLPPGKHIVMTMPVWRTAECLLHAARLARALGDEKARVHFRSTWTGLTGRTIWADPLRYAVGGTDGVVSKVCRQDAVSSYVETRVDEIAATLPDVVERVVKPLYGVFGFFDLPRRTLDDAIAQVRKILS